MSTTEPGRLFLVRHGETEWSRTGRHTSSTDVPLTPEGEARAGALAELLAPIPFALVLTSPMVRARTTAELAGFGEVAEISTDLVEWHYGDYEGQTTPEIRERHPGWNLFSDGVPGGEPAAEVGGRADRIIERVRAVAGDSLCFAHGHLLRVLAARWIGLPPAGARLFALDPASVSVLGWEREVPVIASWNRSLYPLG